jgi:MYXO-CTERM domain-containing protein
MTMRWSRGVLVAMVLLALLAVAAGCGRRDPEVVSTQTRALDTADWMLIQPQAGPVGAHSASMAWLDGLKQVVLFGGGRVGGVSTAWTWTWNGAQWTLKCPGSGCTGLPVARYGAALAQGPTGTAVLYGGCTGQCSNAADFLSDAWQFNGTTWTTLSTAGGMQAVEGAAAAWDPVRQAVLLFGGMRADGTVVNDTWVLQGATWAPVCLGAACGAGLARAHHAMAYDSSTGAFIMHGGLSGGTTLGDTWQLKWDGPLAKYVWTQLSPSTTPGALAGHVMASSTQTTPKSVIMFGGRDATGVATSAMYVWAGGAWSLLTSSGAGPDRRYAATGAYDETRKVFLVWGGWPAPTDVPYGDLWETPYALAWAQRTMSPRAGHGMVSLGSSTPMGRAALFGGTTPDLMDDLWTWRGTHWQRQHPTSATKPSARENLGMAFDEDLGRVVVVAGFDPSTGWGKSDSWSYAANIWTQDCDPCGFDSAGLVWPAMTYDRERKNVVLFGGYSQAAGSASNKIWHGKYTSGIYMWSDACTTSACLAGAPEGRMAAAMAFDATRKVAVVYGGCVGTCNTTADLRADTWEWNGSAWTNPAVGGPPSLKNASMTFDRARGRILLFGGEDQYGTSANQMWEYDGMSWQLVEGVAHPLEWRKRAGLAYDAVAKETVLHGGEWGEFYGDTWLYGAYGGTCSAAAQCDRGYGCVSNVCCATPCTGSCAVCSAAMGSPADGVCGNAPLGSFGNPGCANHLVCSGQGPDCPTTCPDDSLCAVGYYCGSNGACAQQKGTGQVCNPLTDCKAPGCRVCDSGYCVDGVCCMTACDGVCEFCKVGSGSCEPVSSMTDPAGECPDGADPTCGLNSCNGARACAYVGGNTPCATQSCSNGTLRLATTCDGFGGCRPQQTQSCNGFACSSSDPTKCGTTCTPGSGTGCVAGFTCSSDGTRCEGGKPAGASCAGDGECASGVCAGGHCCTGACERASPDCGGKCDSAGLCSYPKDGDNCSCGSTPGTCGTGICRCGQSDGGLPDGGQTDAKQQDAAGPDAPVGDGAAADAVGPQPDGAAPQPDAGGKTGTTSFLGCSAAPAGASALPFLLIGLLAAWRRRRG